MHRRQRGDRPELPGAVALTSIRSIQRRRAVTLGAALILGPALAAGLALSAAAHEGGTVSLDVAVERVRPGGPLPLIGRDWAPGEPLAIELVVGTSKTGLGIIKAGPDGHFVATMMLPADLPAGPADVDAISQTGVIERASFVVDPTAPLPSGEATGVAVPIVTDPGETDIVPSVGLVGAIAALATLAVRTRRRRSS